MVELVGILVKDQIEISSSGNLGLIPGDGGFSNERRTTVSKVKNTSSPIQQLRIMGVDCGFRGYEQIQTLASVTVLDVR